MKKIFTLLTLALGCLSISYAQLSATSGGPDAYGYSWVSSDDSSGTLTKPTFSWIDITSTGTQITGYGDDQGPGAMLPMGFDFPFYWYNINEFYVGANGYIRFTSPLDVSSNGSSGASFPSLPTNDVGNDFNNWVCPLMCDLNPIAAGGGKIYYKTNNTSQLIVSYVDVPFWVDAGATQWQGKNTFQVVFDKADTSITFQYLSRVGDWSSTYNQNANPVVIGIESKAGQAGLMISNVEKPNDSLAVKFKVKKNTAFTLTDISLDWQKNSSNSTIFGMIGRPTWISVNVSNSGDKDVNSDIIVKTTIEKYVAGQTASVNIFKDAANKAQEFTITSMAASTSQEYTYPEALVPAELLAGSPSAGTYVITSKTSFSDGVSDNNTVSTEFVILDNNLDSVSLNYFNVPDLTNNEPVGTFGFVSGGIYVDLPFYPVTLKELYMYVSTDGNEPTDGITLEVFARDANGAVGDLIYSTFVDKSLISYPTAADEPMLPTIVKGIEDNSGNPIVINDKGFYVSFATADVSGNANYALFEDITAPFSLRTYEVNDGLWGNYRSASSADPMIGAVVDAKNATTGVSNKIEDNKLEIGFAYPNPSTGLTTVDFTLAENSVTTFTLSNVIGQKVDEKVFGKLNKGNHQITFDVSKLESGVYFYTFTVNEARITKKLIVK